jgi:hypothetical protein
VRAIAERKRHQAIVGAVELAGYLGVKGRKRYISSSRLPKVYYDRQLGVAANFNPDTVRALYHRKKSMAAPSRQLKATLRSLVWQVPGFW